MERRRTGKRSSPQPPLVVDEPVEFEYSSSSDEDDKPRGSKVAKRHPDSDLESDSEDEYVAYGRPDVEAATDAVVEWLRQRLAPPCAPTTGKKQPEPAGAHSKGGEKKGRGKEGEDLPLPLGEELPHTRQQWVGQADVARLCRVERKVEGLAVLGLLHQAHLLSLQPPSSAAGGDQQPADQAEANEEVMGDTEENDELDVVRGLSVEEVGRVGVEWVAGPDEVARLEEVLTQQLGDGCIILARTLQWLRPRLNTKHSKKAATTAATNKKGGRSKKGGNELGKEGRQGHDVHDSTGLLPNTIKELLTIVEQEHWGVITHRVRPSDVLHELELNEMVEVERDGKLQYNKAKILAEKGAGGNGWKWVLGILLLLFMMLPSWLR